MKFIVIIAALCFLGGSNAQMSLDFLNDNVLNPMINQIYQNTLQALQAQLSQAINSLFGGVGKRGVNELANINVYQVLAPFVAQVKEIYQNIFKVFLQIVQNVGDYVQKPNVAHVRFLQTGDDARAAIANLTVPLDIFKPILTMVQTHLNAMVNNFDGIISQALNAAKPVQSLINNAVNLLKP